MQTTSESIYKLRSLKLSTIAISSVVLVEATLGLIVGSLAIVSDGLHALLDTLTTLALLVATAASLRPPDEEHMYGHEKFEPIGGLIGGIALIGVAILIMYEAVLRLVQDSSINLDLQLAGFIAVGYTFCIDFVRVGILRKALHGESSTMKAGFYHAIADLSSTVIAFLGFGLATLGFRKGDAFASIALSVLLSYLSIKLVWASGMELSDTTPKDVTENVRKELNRLKGIRRYKDLRVRKIGSKTYAEVTIEVPDYMSLEEAHKVTSEMEANVKSILGNAEITIHVEPHQTEMQTGKLVEKLALEVEGVKEAHEINTVYTNGKLYITLHAYVDPKLSIEEAHGKAEEIERRINAEIREAENVMVHIEPLNTRKKKGSIADESEIKKIIQDMGRPWQDALRIRRILTYVADKKRHINIDCCFNKQISIEEAHTISTKVEENIRKHFAETIITVHMEPEQAQTKHTKIST